MARRPPFPVATFNFCLSMGAVDRERMWVWADFHYLHTHMQVKCNWTFCTNTVKNISSYTRFHKLINILNVLCMVVTMVGYVLYQSHDTLMFANEMAWFSLLYLTFSLSVSVYDFEFGYTFSICFIVIMWHTTYKIKNFYLLFFFFLFSNHLQMDAESHRRLREKKKSTSVQSLLFSFYFHLRARLCKVISNEGWLWWNNLQTVYS